MTRMSTSPLTLRQTARPFNGVTSGHARASANQRRRARDFADGLITNWRFDAHYSIMALLSDIDEAAQPCGSHTRKRLRAKAMYYAGMNAEAAAELKPVLDKINQLTDTAVIQAAGLMLAITGFDQKAACALEIRFPVEYPAITLKAENYVQTRSEVPQTRRTGMSVRKKTYG